MKKITQILMVFATSLTINAQTIITHSTSQVIGEGTVACNNNATASSSDNTYYRAFDLPAMGYGEGFDISAIEFGIQTTSVSYPLTINLYHTTQTFPASFPTGYTQLGSASFIANPEHDGTIVSVPFDVTVPEGSKLVVSIGYNAATENGHIIYLGSNNLGQTSPTYISSVGCSIAAPTTMADIGYAGVHLIMNVVGEVLSVNEILSKQVAVYPNPTSGLFTVQIPNDLTIDRVTLVDVAGKQFMVNVNGDNSIDIAEFANGVYTLNVQTTEGILVKRIIKQ